MASDSLTITDNRTGKQYELPIRYGTYPTYGAAIDALDLRTALLALKPEERELLGMRYIAGFNATELSAALGISPSGVRNRLERLTTRLRQELER